MEGKEEPPELRGIIPTTFNHIFTQINAGGSRQYLVSAAYLEVSDCALARNFTTCPASAACMPSGACFVAAPSCSAINMLS